MKEALEDIRSTECREPCVWWLGNAGFAFKHHDIVFFVDPELPVGAAVSNADLILLTHLEEEPAATAVEILQRSPRSKVVVPKSRAEALHSSGVPYSRMTTTDSGLRVEYFKNGAYGRVYSVPSAREGQLDWTPIGGYPRLGYLIRFGTCTIYHAGACTAYDGLAARLRPYNVTLALLPLGGKNFAAAQAAQLAEDISAQWVAPMDCDSEEAGLFTMHMLGHRPSQRFKVFNLGEGWTIPQEGTETGDRVS